MAEYRGNIEDAFSPTSSQMALKPNLPKVTRGKYTSKACIPCRQSKTKCAGGLLCPSCRRLGKVCTYPAQARVRKAKIPLPTTNERPRSDQLNSPTAESISSGNEGNKTVLGRLRNLEQQVSLMNTALHHQPVNSCIDAPCDTEIFEISPGQTANASLSCHIDALKKSLQPIIYDPPQCHRIPDPQLRSQEAGNPQFLRDLPSITHLQQAISLYFEELNHFFPCIDEIDFKRRLSEITANQVEEGGNFCPLVEPSSRTYFMLMCIVLAVATYLDPSSRQATDTTSPGWRYLLMAEEISGREHYFRSGEIDLDLVRYHTIKAMYLIHIERLTAAYRAIGVAVQLAFIVGLNDESTWTGCSEIDKSNRRLLWWTIFYMDRRVAQKCWKPYLIRETEVLVDDLEIIESADFGAATNLETYSEVERKVLTHRYGQTKISWARLWTLVWDSMFAVRAVKGPSRAEEVEILDAKILHVQRQMHETLHWETSCLLDYIAAGESELHMRSRLVTYVRINLLRLIIRQSWKHTIASDARGSQICIDLASDTIEAISAYMKTRTNPVPFGLNAVECAVEAMCHLVPHLKGSEMNKGSRQMLSFKKAIEFLEDLSHSLGAAQRALGLLGEIADKGWLNGLSSNGGLGLDYMPLFSNPIKGFRQESLDEIFSSEWPEICLPVLDMGSFV